MHVLFNMLPSGTPLEIIHNFWVAQTENTAYRKYFYVLLSLSSYVFRHSQQAQDEGNFFKWWNLMWCNYKMVSRFIFKWLHDVILHNSLQTANTVRRQWVDRRKCFSFKCQSAEAGHELFNWVRVPGRGMECGRREPIQCCAAYDERADNTERRYGLWCIKRKGSGCNPFPLGFTVIQ